MKKRLKIFICLVAVFVLFGGCFLAYLLLKDDGHLNPETETIMVRDVIGAGGYGGVFYSKIDPFNDNYYSCACDMGGMYFSYDKGNSWNRHNINGTIQATQYDKSNEGVIWFAGSGVYKSSDHGKTYEMMFPKEENILYKGNNYENGNYWLYDNYPISSEYHYPSSYQVKSICIDESSLGKNVFVGINTPQNFKIYRTINASDFTLFLTVSLDGSGPNHKLFFDESNDRLLVVGSKMIRAYSMNGELEYTHIAEYGITDFASYYDKQSNTNTFTFAQNRVLESEGTETTYDKYVKTILYKTNNLYNQSSYIDLTNDICNKFSNTGKSWNDSRVTVHYKWNISNICLANSDIVYFLVNDNVPESSTYTRGMSTFFKYDAKNIETPLSVVYGYPYYSVYAIKDFSWQDGDAGYCYGFSSNVNNPNELIWGHGTGICHYDGTTVKQLQAKLISTESLNVTDSNGNPKTVTVKTGKTTGIDVQTVYETATNPFNPNHLIMACTDFGMIQSYDNGDSWFRFIHSSISGMANTCYDIEFDKKKPGVVYAIWSSKHDCPYSPSASYMTAKGAFFISNDYGLTWTKKSIKSDDLIIPYRMNVSYDGENRRIYIASVTHGFYMTNNLGESFIEMNDGVQTNTLGTYTAIFGNEILETKQGIFAITSGSAPSMTAHLYKYNDTQNKFDEIVLPKNIAAIRDIVYSNKYDELYLACIGKSLDNYYTLKRDGGGVFVYKNDNFTQIFDKDKPVFGVTLDSKDNLYISQYDGKIYKFDNSNTTYELFVDNLFHIIKNITFGLTDDIMYVATFGGGTERIVIKQIIKNN